MRNSIRFFVFPILLALAGCAMQVANSEHYLEITDRGTQPTLPTVKVGDTIEIALPANATAGFVWKLQSTDDGPVVRSREEQTDVAAYDNGEGGAVGVAGRTVFRFNAAAIGKKTLEFGLIKSWDKGTLPVRIETVSVDVE